MSRTNSSNFSNAILNYGPTLPIGPIADGTLFHLTAGSQGLYVYNFSQDVSSAAGDQVGRGWKLLANTSVLDAGTLNGLPSSSFQLRDADLTAISNLQGIGFAVRTGADTWNTRSLAAGLGITLSNTNGSVGDITIGVSEAALSLNNIGSTLSASKGGTGNTGPFFPGGLIYVGGTTGPLNSTAAGTSGQVLLSGGASAPQWINQSSLSVGTATNASFATSAGTATTASTASSASSVPWTGITGKPTTLSGFGITDSVTKTYIDGADYLNLPPLAGVLRDNIVPVYSDFKFSQGAWNTGSFNLVDRESKQVLFFHTTTPTQNQLMYRAYRYSDTDAWIFDNKPIAVGFQLSTEKIYQIMNMGTNFAVLILGNNTAPFARTRVVIAKTGGSSNSQDWTLGYDVSALYNVLTNANFSLVQTTAGDRILAVFNNGSNSLDSSIFTMNVYNSSLVLLRSQVLLNSSVEVNPNDTLGSGRFVNMSAYNYVGYSGNGAVYGFTWNPLTERFHQHYTSYYVYSQGGANLGGPFGLSLSWSIPKTWFESGTGTPTNLIPIKSGSYRYNLLRDSTWGTQNGGMSSDIIGGGNTSIVTDEYSGDIILNSKSSFNAYNAGTLYRFGYSSGFVYQTWDTVSLSSKLSTVNTIQIPDGSAWSKIIRSYWGHVIGDQMLINAYSNRLGERFIQAQFSTSQFSSIGSTNDTLKVDSPTAQIEPALQAPAIVQSNFNPGNFGVTVQSGTPTYYFCAPGALVYTITASGTNRTYTSTGLTMPALPTTISGQSGISDQHVIVWNLSVGSPIFWAIVKNTAGNVFIAKYSSGSWSIPASNILQTEIDAGKVSRGDTLNSSRFSESGQATLTEGGRFMFNFGVDVTGGTNWYWAAYNVNTNTAVSNSYTTFLSSSIGYGQQGGYPGASFGYSTTLGYYRTAATGNYDAMAFVSSRNITTGASITEDQWFNNTATRFTIWFTTESATGLVAYISSYPLFIGGYYCTTPTQSISLAPSTMNYVYASKAPADRTTVTISSSTTLLPSSFSRVLLAGITTNATNIVSSVSFSVAQEDAVEDLSNVTVTAKQTNDALTWNGTQWVNSPVVRTDETRSGAFTINGALVSGQRDLLTYGVSTSSGTMSPSLITIPASLTVGTTLNVGSSATIGTTLVVTSSVTSQSFKAMNASNGYMIVSSGDSSHSGYVEFCAPNNGARQGYIGYSSTAAGTDSGILEYVSGSHAFTGSITSSGSITAAGDVVAFSDAKLKTNVQTIQNAVSTVQALRGVTFDRIGTGTKSLGVIAQEVQTVLPELVSEADDGTLGVSYGNMVGVLIEAIKEQQKQIDALRVEVQSLKKA